MTKKERKKVIIILAEGNTDIDFLQPYLYDLVDRNKIRFEITNGDLLTKPENSRKNPKSIVGDKISEICRIRKYKDEDISFVIHLLDLDGSYVKYNDILIDKSLDKKYYDLENSKVIAISEDQKKHLINTWNKKRERQQVLYNTPKIKKIKYFILYNSINLEYMISNKILLETEEKEECIDDFLSQNNLESFIKFLKSEDILLADNYKDSWINIENNTDGFKRASNWYFLIEKMQDL